MRQAGKHKRVSTPRLPVPTETVRDLYSEAVVAGTREWMTQTGLAPKNHPIGPMAPENQPLGPETKEYWIARYAARETATALLKSAQLLGLSEDQYEELRKVAAEVAYD